MRTIFALTLCFALLWAATANAASDVAMFNVQKVATECEALKDARAALEKKFGPQKAALDKQRADLEKKVQSLKGKATAKQQADLKKQNKAYTEKAQAFVRIFQADELALRKEIDALMTAAAKELATEKGYSLILDAQAVVFAGGQLDVTEAMLAKINELWAKNKKSAPAAERPAADKGTAPAKPGGK